VHRHIDRERELMAGLPQRLRGTVRHRLEREQDEAARLRRTARTRLRTALETAGGDLGHVRARVRALSPQATLERGYAVVQRRSDGLLVRVPGDAVGPLRVRVAGGEFEAHP
jgi:exodeoxyribonuclease VII large subunit